MAKAITNIKTAPQKIEDLESEAKSRITSALVKNEESVLAFLEIANELQQSGVLDILRGLLKNRHQIGVLGMSQLNQPKAHRLLKNGIQGVQFLGSLEPSSMQKVMDSVTTGMKYAMTPEETGNSVKARRGIFQTLKLLRDPDVSESLTFSLRFLKGMGQDLHGDSAHKENEIE